MHRLQHVFQRQTLVSASPDATVYEVAALMTEARVGAVPVLDGEELVGIFSERDLMTRVVVPGRDPRATRVSDVMSRGVVTGSLEEHVEYCRDKMQRANCRHLPIVSAGRVISMVSMRDLLRDELQEQSDEIRSLRAYLHQAPL